MIDAADPYRDLSSDEMRFVNELTKWSGAAVVREHRALLRLVGKVRGRLEATVDAVIESGEPWVPDMGFSMAYKVTVDGGAKLVDAWYRREGKNPNMALTDEQLEAEIQKAALALFEKIPLADAKQSLRRREYLEERGEERPPKGERFAQNGRLLK